MTVVTQIVDLVHADLADPSVLAMHGRTSLAEHRQLRRVVWIPCASPIVGTLHVGGKLRTEPSGQVVRGREAYTLQYTFEVHVFAEDDDTTEELAFNVLAAVSRVFGGRAAPRALTWETELEGGATGRTKRQPKIRLDLAISTPALNEHARLTPVVDSTLTATLQVPTD